MGLFDWLEGAAAFDPNSKFGKEFDELFPGSYTVTFGSAYSALMPGAQMSRVYGDSIACVIDWEGIIVEGFLSKIPAVHHALNTLAGGLFMSTLAGTGGQIAWAFGRNVYAVYGPTINLQRGPAVNITGKSWLFGGDAPSTGTPTFAPAAPAGAEAKQQTIDKVVDGVTSVLSAIMILVGLASDILAGTLYKTTDGDPRSQANKILGSVSGFITNRILGYNLAIEKWGQNARDAIYRVPSADDQLAIAKHDLECAENVIRANAADLTRRLQQAEDDAYAAEQFLRAAVNQVEQLATGAQETADAAQQAANRTFLEVGNYEIGADGQIYLRADGAVLLEAMQDGGAVLVDADSLASMRCGAAKLILQYADETAEAVLTSGDEGTTRLRAGIVDVGSDLTMTAEETTLQVGEPDVGSLIKMTPLGLTLQVGPPGEGASITFTEASIKIAVGEVTWTMTAAGISELVDETSRDLAPTGETVMSGETVLSVGSQGMAFIGPSQTAEIEAARESSQSLNSDECEADNSQVATMFTIE